MTREEFERRFKGELLYLAFQSWQMRSAKPSEFGLMIDVQAQGVSRLLTQMYDAMTPASLPQRNGPPVARKP